MGKMSTAGVLRLHAPGAVSHDKSVRRFAQDDGFVEVSTKHPNKLMRLTVAQRVMLGYGFKKHVPLDRRDDRFLPGNLVEEVLAGFQVLIYQARGRVCQPLRG
jgi:hypothetical protein